MSKLRDFQYKFKSYFISKNFKIYCILNTQINFAYISEFCDIIIF